MSVIQRIRGFYNDPEYFANIKQIAIPIIIQQFTFAGLNMLGVIFVAQKGDQAVAAVGFAGQITFLLQLVHFGVVSGAAMFTAQFWGRRDVPNLRRVLGLCLLIALSASLLFFALSQFFPDVLFRIFTRDEAVIAMASAYIRAFSWTFLFVAVTFSYSFVMRSTGDVRTPTIISVGALLLSTFLSYALIFGRLGFPEIGIQGAAVAAVISRALECIVLLLVVYRMKSPTAASLKELFGFDGSFVSRVIKPMSPVILNELFWALGITTYNAIYGRMGTDSFAAMSIVATIEQMAFVVFMGISNATSVLVGNRIGAGREEEAHAYAGRSLGLGVVGGLIMGLLLLLIRTPVLSLYKVSPLVISNAAGILTVMAFFIWIRVNNMTIVVGVLRAGGDTRFSLFLDGIIIWLIGVPMAWLGANAWNLPVYFVYLCAMSEEVTKWVLGMYRYFSRKWIHNLAVHVEGI